MKINQYISIVLFSIQQILLLSLLCSSLFLFIKSENCDCFFFFPFLIVTHSLKYFYTASSGIQTFPEFVAVGIVDEIEMIHFDSLTAKAELKHDWVHTVTKAHPEYLEYNTENFVVTQEVYKTNMEVAKERFNQSGGLFVV